MIKITILLRDPEYILLMAALSDSANRVFPLKKSEIDTLFSVMAPETIKQQIDKLSMLIMLNALHSD